MLEWYLAHFVQCRVQNFIDRLKERKLNEAQAWFCIWNNPQSSIVLEIHTLNYYCQKIVCASTIYCCSAANDKPISQNLKRAFLMYQRSNEQSTKACFEYKIQIPRWHISSHGFAMAFKTEVFLWPDFNSVNSTVHLFICCTHAQM